MPLSLVEAPAVCDSIPAQLVDLSTPFPLREQEILPGDMSGSPNHRQDAMYHSHDAESEFEYYVERARWRIDQDHCQGDEDRCSTLVSPSAPSSPLHHTLCSKNAN
jgi:hypothetical protein